MQRNQLYMIGLNRTIYSLLLILLCCSNGNMAQRFQQPRSQLSIPLLLPITSSGVVSRYIDRDHDDQFDVLIPGDIVLGGLFPIHEDGSPEGKHCGSIKPDKGIQRMEAMLFALDEINNQKQLLPGLKLGAHILDTCNQDTHGLEQTLKFIKFSLSQENVHHYECADGKPAVNKAPKPVPAVIGAASSQVSAMVANVLRLFKIPQISYSSTSTELSDKTRFTYFSRVVPPDDLQAQAMADVVKSLGWTYVSALHDEGSYGEQGIEGFTKHATDRNICIALTKKIKRDFREVDYIELIKELKRQRGRGVIMYVNEDNIKKVLKTVNDMNLNSYFAWVASDNWGNKRSAVQDHPDAAIGAITIQPKMKRSESFDLYFTRLNPRTKKVKYKWFDEFWKHNFNCSRLDRACLTNSLMEKHQQESYVPFVIDAVYLAAHALSRYFEDYCTSRSLSDCKQLKIDGTKLLHYIRNTSFVGAQDEVRLNKDGDRMIRYIIYQYRGFGDQYLPIGEWVSSELSLNQSLIRTGYAHGGIPESQCGRPCTPIEYRSNTHSACCWECLHCNESSIRPNETSCFNCQIGYRPNFFKNECIPLVPDTLQWTSPFALGPACFAAMGITATLFVVIVFIKHNKTPVIMASGRELCYIMLSGIFFCYLMTFAVLYPPSKASCGVQRMGLGLCLCIIYAAILTKTSRLSRIFTSNVRALQRPRFISPRAQVIICGFLVSLQVIGSAVWLIKSPPNTSPMYAMNWLSVTIACEVTPKPMLGSFSYIALLITLCTYYAFKTRKIPENFNETKHIGFTMYATCIIWLSFVPIYFGTKDNFKVQATSLCMCLSASGTVALCCFFAPKIYIVLFQPDKNTRHHGGTSSQATGFHKMQMSVVNQQMRFLNRPPPNDTTVSQNTGSDKVPATATPSLFSVKSSGSTQGVESYPTSKNSQLNSSKSSDHSTIVTNKNNTTDSGRYNIQAKGKNRSTRNKLKQFVPSLFSSTSSSNKMKFPLLSQPSKFGKQSKNIPKNNINNNKDMIISNKKNQRTIGASDGGVSRQNSTKYSSVSTSNFSPNSVITENTPFLFSICQNKNNNDNKVSNHSEGIKHIGKSNEDTKSDKEYSSVFLDGDEAAAAAIDTKLAKIPKTSHSTSSGDTSPDSYTEPVRRKPKEGKFMNGSDDFITTALVNSNANHRSDMRNKSTKIPTINPGSKSNPGGKSNPSVQSTSHDVSQTPGVTNSYPKALQDGPKLHNNSRISHQQQQPHVHNIHGQKNELQPDWILIDPQNEFESIISGITNQEATFV